MGVVACSLDDSLLISDEDPLAVPFAVIVEGDVAVWLA